MEDALMSQSPRNDFNPDTFPSLSSPSPSSSPPSPPEEHIPVIGSGSGAPHRRESNASYKAVEAKEDEEDDGNDHDTEITIPIDHRTQPRVFSPGSANVELSEFRSGSLSLSLSNDESLQSPGAHTDDGEIHRMGVASTLVNEQLARLRTLMMADSSETGHEEVEMLDFDNPEDHVNELMLFDSSSSQSSSLWRSFKLTLLRTLMTICVGIATGLTGFMVSKAVTSLIHANLSVITNLMNADQPAGAFFSTLLISTSFTFVAALFVTIGSWQIRGSGVGRLNCYLSGMYSSRFLTFKTLIFKVAGLILTVSAGIKQGMEGPFIHIGAMLGLHVTRIIAFILRLIGGRFGLTKYLKIVSGVVDERQFITSGAAAGFSVAFNAPIAGVLYVMDGAFAYWNGEYTIRTFICTMTAVITVNLCFMANSVLPTRGLIDIERAKKTEITAQEFWGFVILGVLGGLLGALFTKFNLVVEKLRVRHLGHRRLNNILDVVACTVSTVLLSFVLPYSFSCHNNWSTCNDHPDRCLRYHCGPEKYSDLATFFFTLPEEALRMLFDRTLTTEAEMQAGVLVVFCIFYFILAAVSYNMAVPGGLFIPSIMIGACYGRLLGIGVRNALPPTPGSETDPDLGINPGVYAVLGSASMLGGVTRMTLPITVMMIEITSDAQFLIPIMLVVLLAKVIADRLIGSLYQEHLRLDGLMMVFGDQVPPLLKKYTARDIMSRPPLIRLNVIERVSNCVNLIRHTTHNAFPVVDNQNGTLRQVLNRRMRLARASQDRSSSSQHSHEQDVVKFAGRGIFLGLIKRRHLAHVLNNMPCFATPQEARASEILTADYVDPNPPSDERHNSNMNGDLHHASNGTRRAGNQTLPLSASQEFVQWAASQDPFRPIPSPTPRAQTIGTFALSASARPAAPATSTAAVLERPNLPLAVEPHPLLNNSGMSRFAPWSWSQAESIHDVNVRSEMMGNWVNLSPFIDSGAYIVQEDMSARRIWSMFRSLGMRHIVVVDADHMPVGIITRGDLIMYACAPEDLSSEPPEESIHL